MMPIVEGVEQLAPKIQQLAAALRTSDPTSMGPTSFLATVQSTTVNKQSLLATLTSTDVVGDFIFFPKLPVELRLKIRKEALPGSRILELFYDVAIADEGIDHHISIAQNAKPAVGIIRANLSPSALLHVSPRGPKSSLKEISPTRCRPSQALLHIDGSY